MIKIIKQGTKRRIECKECGALLEFQNDDKKIKQVGMNEYNYYIVCPCCNEEIRLH